MVGNIVLVTYRHALALRTLESSNRNSTNEVVKKNLYSNALLYPDIQAEHECPHDNIGSEEAMEPNRREENLRDWDFRHVIRVFLAALDERCRRV